MRKYLNAENIFVTVSVLLFVWALFEDVCRQDLEHSQILEKRREIVDQLLRVVEEKPEEKDVLENIRKGHAKFFRAIAVVESGDRDNVVGDRGKALGRFQIWKVYWQDAVSKFPSLKDEGNYDSCLRDGNYSERVVAAYFLRYGKKFLEAGDYESLARIHNGGPKGHLRSSTVEYWKRVKKALGQ